MQLWQDNGLAFTECLQNIGVSFAWFWYNPKGYLYAIQHIKEILKDTSIPSGAHVPFGVLRKSKKNVIWDGLGMKRILVIEDEIAINDLICMNLEIAGYEPIPFLDGAIFSAHLKEQDDYDLALLDIMLPGKDGFVLLEELKQHQIPVIYLTAKGDLPSKVKGLRSGAEDYIVKPFEMLELLVRMDNVLKRFSKEEEEIRIKDVVINEKKRTVHKAGTEVLMQPMEFDCLLAFWKYRNRVMTREQILNLLWGVDFNGESRTVDVHVGNIRKKLDFADVIITVPRVGYRMEVSNEYD